MNYVIEAKDLSFGYPQQPLILEALSFAIEKGSYVAIVGPNGAGKTTLLRLILGLSKPVSGEIRLLGDPMSDFRDWQKIGYLPQQVSSFNPMFPASVSEIVSFGLIAGGKGLSGAQKRQKIISSLESLGIANLADKAIGRLSGGQQQRVFLARALAGSPEILILDEPSTALDPKSREMFFGLLEEINRKQGVTVILITHDISHIKHHATQVLYLDRKLMFYGPCSELCLEESGHRHLSHYL
jgi:zinc transport system ATP-binding protein